MLTLHDLSFEAFLSDFGTLDLFCLSWSVSDDFRDEESLSGISLESKGDGEEDLADFFRT